MHEDSGQMRQADHRAAPGASPVSADGGPRTEVGTAGLEEDAGAGSPTAALPGHKQQGMPLEAEVMASEAGKTAEEAAAEFAGADHGADACAPDLEAASPSDQSSTEEVSRLAACDAEA